MEDMELMKISDILTCCDAFCWNFPTEMGIFSITM